jgi:membrane associated rhomboid family serine protease
MFMMVPYSAALSLAQRPYVTYAVILLCVVIHYFQDQNRDEIGLHTVEYCTSIHDSSLGDNALDILRSEDIDECVSDMTILHDLPDKTVLRTYIEEYNEEEQKYTAQEVDKLLELVMEHYRDFSLNVPASLDEKLVYNPASWNPLTMFTSSLAHGDWWHITFNLIFFFAFAPALEILIGHSLKYIGVLLGIVVATGVSYSISTIGSAPVPTLGLSGVVMGMIGLSAFLMPNAHIRTFVWFIWFFKTLYIPAWILALFYIGWDTWDLMVQGNGAGGVNLLSHVSGGIAGYLIGRKFFKVRREETRDELNEEIELQKSDRNDKLGRMRTHKVGLERLADQRRQNKDREAYYALLDRVGRMVRVHQDSDAVALLLEHYDGYSLSVEIYDEIFEEMAKWGRSRALLCIGRLNIENLLNHGRKGHALEVADKCHQFSPEFVLANPDRVLEMAKLAVEQEQYELAVSTLNRAKQRYGSYLNVQKCQKMEAWILSKYLDKGDEAISLLRADGRTVS